MDREESEDSQELVNTEYRGTIETEVEMVSSVVKEQVGR